MTDTVGGVGVAVSRFTRRENQSKLSALLGPGFKTNSIVEDCMGSTLTQVIISLISGGVGGNIAGALLKNFNLGPIGNTIVGLIGGGLGGQLLSATGLLQSTGTVGDIAGSAVGGGVLMAIVGLIKNAMASKA
jgi:uncharacterized membrane protein YeaQ/YmgE (transglycosylase-associated protein family)